MTKKKLTVVQMLPELESGGVERGTLEMGKYLVDRGHRSIVISSGGRMVEQLLLEGSEHVDWAVGKKTLSTIRYIKKVRNFLRETKPDILHLRSRLPAWIGYLAWKKLPRNDRPKLVTTVHGRYSVGKYSSVMVRGEKIIAVSGMIREYILDNYSFVDPEDITVIHRGVDTNEYTPEYQATDTWKDDWFAQYPKMQGKQLLTLPARLTRWKGQEDFVQVIETLKNDTYHGVIVGSAHPKKQEFADELRRLIKAKGLTEYVTMVGHRTDMKEILSISSIVFSLSTDPEAFGRTTIEALSLGTSVIGYDHGGVKEQLDAVFPQGAVTLGSIDEAVRKINSWGMSLPTPGRNVKFTLDGMCSRILKVYTDLVSDG